jgi:hypothetical protein
LGTERFLSLSLCFCRHSGARRRREPGISMHDCACIWIPGPALRAGPE